MLHPASAPRFLPRSDRCSRWTDELVKIYSIRLSVIHPYNHTARPPPPGSDRCSRRTDELEKNKNLFYSSVRHPSLSSPARIGVRDGQTNWIKFYSIRLIVIHPYNHTARPPPPGSDLCSRRTDELDKIYFIRLIVIHPYNHTARPLPPRLGSVFATDRRIEKK